jgi:hypothetical protein
MIDDMVDNYNHTTNRDIGTEPGKVNMLIENEIIQNKKE